METIYVALVGEDIDVWRPVQAHQEAGFVYRIADAPSPEGEAWEFPPGSVVTCEWRELSDGPALVAVRSALRGHS